MNKTKLLLALISVTLIGGIGLAVQSNDHEIDQDVFIIEDSLGGESEALNPSVLAGEDDFIEDDITEDDITEDDEETSSAPDNESSSINTPMGTGIVSPIKYPTLMALLEYLVRLLFWLGVTGMTLIVVYGAFLMITAGGDPAKFGKGQKVITYAVLGLILILLSWAIVAIIRSVLSTS